MEWKDKIMSFFSLISASQDVVPSAEPSDKETCLFCSQGTKWHLLVFNSEDVLEPKTTESTCGSEKGQIPVLFSQKVKEKDGEGLRERTLCGSKDVLITIKEKYSI